MLLEDQYVWVTGASRGIGKACAILCAAHGATVIINGRNQNSLEEVQDLIKSEGGHDPIVAPYDAANPQEIKYAFSQILKQIPRLDGLINNAGILEDALLGMITRDSIERVFSINTFAVMEHMQYASRFMARKGHGSIVNISSIIGRVGNEGQVAYSGSKAAVIGMTQSASKELAKSNIRVNTIAPGFIRTDMTRQIPEQKYKQRLSEIKMGRIGEPEEVANVALFLLSSLSSYVTGQTIGVDGGMIL